MAKQDDELDDFGRFAEPALMILISLADGPKHGYAMTDDIDRVAGVRFGSWNCTATGDTITLQT